MIDIQGVTMQCVLRFGWKFTRLLSLFAPHDNTTTQNQYYNYRLPPTPITLAIIHSTIAIDDWPCIGRIFDYRCPDQSTEHRRFEVPAKSMASDVPAKSFDLLATFPPFEYSLAMFPPNSNLSILKPLSSFFSFSARRPQT